MAGYGAFKVNIDSALKIKTRLISIDNNYPFITIPKLHCTLMYDKSNPNIHVDKNNDIHVCKIIGVDLLGEDSVVLLLESDSIKRRFKELTDIGFKHSFDDLLIHTSIIYSKDKEQLQEVYEKVKNLYDNGEFNFPVILEKEYWEDIDNGD